MLIDIENNKNRMLFIWFSKIFDFVRIKTLFHGTIYVIEESCYEKIIMRNSCLYAMSFISRM